MAVRKPTLSKRRQVTIPREMIAAAGLQSGTPIQVRLTNDGILIERASERDPDQWWFWTTEWQAKEREVDEDLATGPFTRHMSDEAFRNALLARIKPE